MDEIVTNIAMEIGVIEVHLWRRLPRPAVPACPATSKPEPLQCPDSRFSVWPAEWPLPPLPKPKPDPPKLPERWPAAIRLGGGGWAEVVAAGWGSAGVAAEFGARYRAVSFGFEAHGDPALGSKLYPEVGVVSFARVSGALLLCAHLDWFVGCGVGDAGRILFPNHVYGLPASAFYGAVGARAGLEFPIFAPRVFFRTAVDMRAPLRPASYSTARGNFFEVAGPGVGLGFALLYELAP
jgi:hypothetical protein